MCVILRVGRRSWWRRGGMSRAGVVFQLNFAMHCYTSDNDQFT